MRAVLRVISEALALTAIGAAVGLAGNAVRERGLTLAEPYFGITETDAAGVPASDPGTTDDDWAVPNPGVTVITLEEATALFHSPDHVPGTSDTLILFLDARDDEAFEAGHIPGAMQLFHYYKDQYLPDVLPVVEQVEKVIVYCNGGKCEDSVLVCMDLLEEEVPIEKLLLFKDGWEVWTAEGLPGETGAY